MNILVIGDSCTDEFIYGQCKRLAPEGPVPIFSSMKRIVNRGMAGNVEANLKSLGCKTLLITNQEEIIKTRYVDDETNQLIVRIDVGDKVNRCHDILSYNGYDAIVISDYNKGFLLEEDIDTIGQTANIPIFMDTKKRLTEKMCEAVSFIKVNQFEYKLSEEILYNFKERVIITMGNNGAMYNSEIFPVERVEIKDLSGAGDTFLAGLVVGYLQNNCDIIEGIKFANECATKVVQRRGVSIV